MLRSGVIGAGFIGEVHSRAVRAAGGDLVAIADSQPGRAAVAAQRWGAQRSASSAEELIASPDIDVVHVCTPNHTHVALASQALDAGKHVICEKPLATDVDGAERLVKEAAQSGKVAAVPFVYRFYPTVREARARIGRGDAGDLRLLHGFYLQDWLSHAEDSDWRVQSALGGASRAFADIGVHWVDLVEFTSGHRITQLCASTMTAHPERGSKDDSRTVDTEDAAGIIFRTDRGALGSLTVSQVSLGHKNMLWFSLEGDQQSFAFNQELPEHLWVGERESVSLIARGSDGSSAEANRFNRLPSGHPQGYQDCFTALVADVYAAASGQDRDGLPTFSDGLRAAAVTAAVLDSAATGEWRDVK